MHCMLTSARGVVQKAGAIGPLQITSADLARGLYPQETAILTQALLFALKMDTQRAFQRTRCPTFAFSLPCPLPMVTEQDRGSNGCAVERRGLLAWVIPQVCPVVDTAGAGGSSPSSKTHGHILQVEEEGDTVKCSSKSCVFSSPNDLQIPAVEPSPRQMCSARSPRGGFSGCCLWLQG